MYFFPDIKIMQKKLSGREATRKQMGHPAVRVPAHRSSVNKDPKSKMLQSTHTI